MTSDWYRKMVDPSTPQFPTSGKIKSNIVQLEKGTLNVVQHHGTLTEYIRSNNLEAHHYANIYNNLNKSNQSAYGYTWMWIEDYEIAKKNEHKN